MSWKTIFGVLVVGALVVSEYNEMCRSMGRGDIPEELEKKAKKAFLCINDVIDPDVLKQEFTDALPSNSFTSLVKKYCLKASKVKDCIKELYSAPDPCLPQFILNSVITVHNATKIVIDFICYNDGESINSFAADGGFQCMNHTTDRLGECGANITDIPPDNSPSSHEVHCNIIHGVETCVTSVYDSCPTPVVVNLAKPFFAIARKAHSCP